MSELSGLGMRFGQHVLRVFEVPLLGGTPASLAEMEEGVRESLLEVGRVVLETWLALQESRYPEATVACSCGDKAVYQWPREATLHTLLGTVRYKRAYYLCPTCHEGRCPLDERLGLRPGEMSADLEKLVGMTGAVESFGKGSDLFERLTLVGISPQSMDKATENYGEEVMAVESEWMAESNDPRALAEQERAGKDGRRLYGTLDAVKVHCRERRSEDDEGWRDLKIGAWFQAEAQPPASPDDSWDIRAHDITYYCDLAEAERFGGLVWASGFRREALRASELVFVADGADWIWNIVKEHYPEATQIVDWFHAKERLGVVARAAFSDGERQKEWLHGAGELLWAGRVDDVIELFRGLMEQGHGVEEARKATGYFSGHRERMNYAEFRAKGYQIGSGTVESACKQIGLERMKVPGATWSLEGARRTAKARASLLSNQWDALAARRTHLARAA